MFSIFSREVRACIRALQDAEARYPDMRSLGLSGQIRSRLRRESRKTVTSIKEDGLSPAGVVWLLASNLIDPEISLGHNHTYRGVLGMRGRAYLALWHVAISHMTDEGVHSPEDEAKERTYIRERISEAG